MKGGRRAFAAAAAAIVVLGLTFLLAVFVVDPSGEFPLNDDWSFAHTARILFDRHDWRPLGWAGMTLISQSSLGALTCSLSSCSFEHLRTATLIVGFALLLGSFALFRTVGGSMLGSVLSSVVTVFNPVMYGLLYTFMTDIAFEAMLLVSFYLCVLSLKSRDYRAILLAGLAIAWATLCRQLGVSVAIAFLLVYPLASGEAWPRRLVKASTPFFISAVTLVVFERWMRETGRLPALYDTKVQDLLAALEAPVAALAKAVLNLILAALYFGFLCCPVLLVDSHIAGRDGIRRVLSRPPGRVALYVTLAALVFMVKHQAMMPLLGNVLDKRGIGPFTLRDTYILQSDSVPELPALYWTTITLLGLVGAWALVYRVTTIGGAFRPRHGAEPAPGNLVGSFALVTVLIYLLPVLPGDMYDRYLGAVVPLVCVVILASQPARQRGVPTLGTGLACGTAGFLVLSSVLATHDYLSWNRARWHAIDELESRRDADAGTLDGGFEYNGDRSYDPAYVADPSKSWWWVKRDDMMITFGPLPGLEVVARYPYPVFFPVSERFIYVLRRAARPGP